MKPTAKMKYGKNATNKNKERKYEQNWNKPKKKWWKKKQIRKNVNGWNGARRNERENRISSKPLKWMQLIQIESFSVYENE